MPKIKSHGGSAKRFRVTKTGKVLRRHSGITTLCRKSLRLGSELSLRTTPFHQAQEEN